MQPEEQEKQSDLVIVLKSPSSGLLSITTSVIEEVAASILRAMKELGPEAADEAERRTPALLKQAPGVFHLHICGDPSSIDQFVVVALHPARPRQPRYAGYAGELVDLVYAAQRERDTP